MLVCARKLRDPACAVSRQAVESQSSSLQCFQGSMFMRLPQLPEFWKKSEPSPAHGGPDSENKASSDAAEAPTAPQAEDRVLAPGRSFRSRPTLIPLQQLEDRGEGSRRHLPLIPFAQQHLEGGDEAGGSLSRASSSLRTASLSHSFSTSIIKGEGEKEREEGEEGDGSESKRTQDDISIGTSTFNPFASIGPTWDSLVTNVQNYFKGSKDDIGWMQRDLSLPPVTDKTEKFDEILHRVVGGERTLSTDYAYLLVPGLFSNLSPFYLADTKERFAAQAPCQIAKIHSESGVEANAKELRRIIVEMHEAQKKPLIILGHSKGGLDAAAAVTLYEDELRDKVAGLVLAQSPYGGTPLASDLLFPGPGAASAKAALGLVMDKIFKGDLRCLEDLTYEKRREFIRQHPLPSWLPTVSFHSEASRSTDAFLASYTIAQAPLPWATAATAAAAEATKDAAEALEEAVKGDGGSAQAAASSAAQQLTISLPLSAACSLLALNLELKYAEASDGLVTRKDAEVPGSMVVCIKRKLDHAFMVFPVTGLEGEGGSAPQICEALVALLLEERLERRPSPSGGGPLPFSLPPKRGTGDSPGPAPTSAMPKRATGDERSRAQASVSPKEPGLLPCP